MKMIQKLSIQGAKGKISMLLQTPQGHEGENIPLAILMHGFMANKKLEPLKTIASELEKRGIASLRFDFDGHGESEGKFSEMTVLTELDDAQRVYAHAVSMGWKTIGFAGHSQGGVVAGMLAGRLGSDKVRCVVQLAPAAVLRDDALNGVLMGRHYDPKDPPETLWVFFHRVGKGYFTVAQTLPIYETSAMYTGPVCLIHGTRDSIVPYGYSEKYHEVYQNSELHILEKENHFLSKRRKEVVETTVAFLEKHLKGNL
ncbi:MAG: alpha/beta fold hydrolase [Bacteroidales bacterium]|nr:alpha/beta fold hydrolase [Bacteroidales bacterium]